MHRPVYINIPDYLKALFKMKKRKKLSKENLKRKSNKTTASSPGQDLNPDLL